MKTRMYVYEQTGHNFLFLCLPVDCWLEIELPIETLSDWVCFISYAFGVDNDDVVQEDENMED